MAQAAASAGQLDERRRSRTAQLQRGVTARVEWAADGNLAGPWRPAGNDIEPATFDAVRVVGRKPRHGTQQGPRVGVRRSGEDLLGSGLLHGVSGVHHGHVVGDGRHDTEVVGDQHESHLPLGLDLGEQPEDLRLDGDVERRGRLVGDEHLRVHRQGGGDHHPLAHAAGELMRIVAGSDRRLVAP